ncbi:uncharacterized protein LOC126740610 isoform X2 [Anthonomus grandis grandis]|nr:uncharacterized protein LOC126740610 isoform X2 [Anthonomus grandis grandis]
MSGINPSSLMDPLPVVLYNNNDPLFICPAQDNIEECTFMFNSDFICNNSTVVFPPSYYSSCNDGPQEIDFTTMKMMPIIYKNQPKDQPEFVDVNSLTSSLEEAKMGSPKEEDNEVIFVGEFQKEPTASSSTAIRRNPARRARTIERRRHLQKEHLLEEDFAFLDQIDEDCLVSVKAKPSQPKSITSITEPKDSSGLYFKEWPLNVYERPEYCEDTGRIEPFDYSIRNIENKQVKKRSVSCLETCPKEKPKPKKKYVYRKRRSKVKKTIDKVPLDDSLRELVKTTYDMLNEFNQEKKLTGCDELVQNQAVLLGVLEQSLISKPTERS